ncbi:GTPase [bacterium]|nr:GTPase [bacterium]
MRRRVLIMGAAGRDFHNFNLFFRDNEDYEVVCFTAAQIPDIEGRKYPAELAGRFYPKGIPIYPEEELPDIISREKIDDVVFAYSDVSHEYVMHRASIVLSAGASFVLLGPKDTMLKSSVPVVAVCAIRTGSGKSQTSRRVADILRGMGKKVVVVRHPMPYGDIREQVCQRFATYGDLDKHRCTIEEREEYEPHIDKGTVVYAGVDYGEILKRAEKEADIILWDGGNNDMPFYEPDLLIVVADPLRVGDELSYHPGESNLRMADVVVVNKVVTADYEDVCCLEENIRTVNPEATIVEAASPFSVDDPQMIAGKDVLVIEDGPTLTHGEMSYGVGYIAAMKFGARRIVDPREYAVGSIKTTYEKYPTTGEVLPAMGYSEKQIAELAETVNKTPADVVVIGTPIDIRRVICFNKPAVRVRYELQEVGKPDLSDILKKKFQ